MGGNIASDLIVEDPYTRERGGPDIANFRALVIEAWGPGTVVPGYKVERGGEHILWLSLDRKGDIIWE